MTPFDWFLIASCLFDIFVCAVSLGVAAYWVSSRGTAQVDAGLFIVTAFCAMGIIVAKTAASLVMGVRLFGLIHMLYLDVAFVAPVVGILILFGRYVRVRRIAKVRFGKFARAAAMLSLLLIPICLYATFVEPFDLRVEKCSLEVPGLDAADDPVTVAVLADLQFAKVTAHEHRAIDMALAAKPDIILIPGDVFQCTARQFEQQEHAIRSLLKRLRAPGGVYLVSGDCDHPDRLRRAIEGTQIKHIDNRIVRTKIRGNTIAIAGVELRYNSPQARATVRNLKRPAKRSDLTILLAHRPGVAMQAGLPDGIDLIVAGHTHGGQVQIPGFGPPITLSSVPRKIAAGGLGLVNGHNIYVSRGVGCERGQAPRIRFCCPPEVSILSLTASPALAP